MADIVNLRTARKRKNRINKEKKAEHNRAYFGLTKHEKNLASAERDLAISKHERHKKPDPEI